MPCKFRKVSSASITTTLLIDHWLILKIAARKHLQDAMAVTCRRQEIMVGEHARCLFKMSEVVSRVPGRELEADRMLTEAENLYCSRMSQPESRLTTLTEDDYDALVFLFWR